MTELPDGWWESAGRISGHCASTYRGGHVLTWAERSDAALDAIVQHVADHGWPHPDLKPVFQAGAKGIDRATWERRKHVIRGEFWLEPSGMADALAEHITDRIAVWQVIWTLTEGQWEAVWAVAEVMKRGGHWRDGAALIGASPSTFATQLGNARARARQAWVAPGDTPPRHYGLVRDQPGDYRTWRRQRRKARAA